VYTLRFKFLEWRFVSLWIPCEVSLCNLVQGTKLMTPQKAKAIWAIYVWCRRTDELVDGPNASRITPAVRTHGARAWLWDGSELLVICMQFVHFGSVIHRACYYLNRSDDSCMPR
jgi:hypothetical protein